jgi:hypothetical protein
MVILNVPPEQDSPVTYVDPFVTVARCLLAIPAPTDVA